MSTFREQYPNHPSNRPACAHTPDSPNAAALECGCQLTTDPNGYRVRLFVGPCGAVGIAAKIRAAGFVVDVEGTEHVHYRAPYVDGWGGMSACDAVAKAIDLPWVGNLDNWTIINTY